jgi:small subunit ribosomal protein S3
LRAEIDFGLAEARTTYGVIGVKVWVFTGYVPDAQIRQRALGTGVSSAEPAMG